MNLIPTAKWLPFLWLASAALGGCGAFEPPPPEYPHATVTFEVTVPSDTPADVGVAVVGSDLNLGGDRAPGFHLRRQGEGRYTGMLRVAVGADVSYDLWQGDVWIPEVTAEGSALSERRSFRVEGDMTVKATVAGWGEMARGPTLPPGLTGFVRHHRAVTSRVLSKARDVIVYLPPGYFDGTGQRYPVLYMHDGQNLMDVTTANAGEWRVDETAEQLIQAGEVAPVIIVGVSNTTERIPEYTPVADPSHGGGKAEAYGRFLVEELKPMIDARYRTRPGAEDTGLAGSSLGGLVSLHLGLEHPGTFTRLGVMSPSVWWANREILDEVRSVQARPPLKIWLDMGTREEPSALSDARGLREALGAKGWGPSDLKYTEVDGASHNEAAWAARFGDVLRYLYPGR